MRNRILGMSIAIAALLGSSTTFAQSPDNAGNTNAQTEQKKDFKNKRGGKKASPSNRVKKSKRDSVFNPFNGIQLTEDQQQRLRVLREGLGPVMPERKPDDGVNKNLSEEQKKQLKKEMQAKKGEAKKKYLAGVKEILSPDQYVVFLENVYLLTPQSDASPKGKSPKTKKSHINAN